MVMVMEKYMAPNAAALALGVSAQTVVIWFDNGKLRGVRTPIGRLIEREAVEELVAERRDGRVA